MKDSLTADQIDDRVQKVKNVLQGLNQIDLELVISWAYFDVITGIREITAPNESTFQTKQHIQKTFEMYLEGKASDAAKLN